MKKVLCHGCFDVLHAGHLAYFQEAKKYGDYLIVSITTDRFVNKGPGRPYFPVEKRAGMVKALSVVDEVFISDEATAIGAIRRFQPDFYVKGPDYKDLTKDFTGEIINEKRAVEEHGGQLVFTEEETYSSSTIINRFFEPFSDQQKKAIQTVQDCGGMGAVRNAIQAIEKLNALVIGEPILDIYRFVTPEGISSKSPSISARLQSEETYRGGSLAIGAHLEGFCKETRVQCHNAPPAQKIRYISGQQRIFEVTNIQDEYWKTNNPEFFCDKIIELSRQSDVTIIADFGHGLFEGQVLRALEDLKGFIGLNVQTNSSNFGFNVYTKHKRYDYLCLDTREARIATHDRFSNPMEIANNIYIEQLDMKRPLSITLGPNGACLFDNAREFNCPSFTDTVIDAVGAGDAYFAITTCLLASECKSELIPFIGNVFAGLKTKIIGNKSSVSKASLLKACEALLK